MDPFEKDGTLGTLMFGVCLKVVKDVGFTGFFFLLLLLLFVCALVGFFFFLCMVCNFIVSYFIVSVFQYVLIYVNNNVQFCSC